jgi:hypothetical protein|tara:strand:- start:2114 stop:3802 length:1689 start_codon:yes stop_codon:yes gene_type:complete
MANRIPLVIDTDNQNKISELPTGDNLDLSNSQIIGVSSLSTGSLVINSVPFSGSYNDLTNKPTIATDVASLTDVTNKIPTILTQLNISDGSVGQVLTTDGGGNFTFSTLAQSGGDTIVVQGGDITGIQIAGDDSVPLTVAGNNTLKFEGAGTITTSAAEVSGTTVLTITGSDNNTTYTVQTADGVSGDSKRLQLVSNTAVTDNITFKEGANVTITRDPGSDTLEFEAANTVNSYTISSETNGATQTTLRLSESGGAIDEVAFVGGTDIDVVRTDAGTITINNTFTETAQLLLQTVNSDGGSYTAQSAVDEFYIVGGTGITTSSSGSNVSVAFNGTNIPSIQFTSGVSITEFSSDATLAGNSNSAVPTEQAVKTYVDGEIAGVGGGGGGGGNAFGNIVVDTQSTVGADQATDNLTLVAGDNISITTDATADSVTFAFTPAGANTQLQWNNNGVLGASNNMTWNDGSNTLSVTNIVATTIEANTIQAPSSLVGTYTISSPTTITLDPTSEVQLDAPIKLQGKTVAQLASFVASAGSIVAVTDNSYKPAYYNGSVWKYVGDDSNV